MSDDFLNYYASTVDAHDRMRWLYYFTEYFNDTFYEYEGGYWMTEQNIILAVIGMVGLFATATIWQRANRIATNYYKANKWLNQKSG